MRRIILIVLSVSIIYGVIAGSTATLRTGVFSAEDWQSLFINGLARGSVYALIAIGMNRHIHPTARRRIFNGIIQQIGDHPLN